MYSNNYEPDDPRTTEVPETMDLSEIDARLVD